MFVFFNIYVYIMKLFVLKGLLVCFKRFIVNVFSALLELKTLVH